MRLLIITQKVDMDDPVLGFFHTWIVKLASKFESITVICLEIGRFNLPTNVKIFSLGKEKGRDKLGYIFRFFNHSFFSRLRGQESLNYDSVFVHMNQEYVLLGGLFWKILSKKIYFWRNHVKGNILTKIAVWLSSKVFYTSPQSFTAKFKKSIIMPVGIDMDRFQTTNHKSPKNSVLMLGRISPIKNIHLALEAARILVEKGVEFNLNIVGDPANPEDIEYKKKLVLDNKDLIGSGYLNFMMSVPNYKTPEIYAAHEIFVNLTSAGSMDKTILESVACGCLPLVINPYFSSVFGQKMITREEPKNIAGKLEFWLNAPEDTKNEWKVKLQKYVDDNHDLDLLIEKLADTIKK